MEALYQCPVSLLDQAPSARNVGEVLLAQTIYRRLIAEPSDADCPEDSIVAAVGGAGTDRVVVDSMAVQERFCISLGRSFTLPSFCAALNLTWTILDLGCGS